MEGQGQVVKNTVPTILIVLPHCVQQCLFVANYKILTHVVVDFYALDIDLSQGLLFELVRPFSHFLGQF